MSEGKQIVVKFNIEDVVLNIIPALLRKHDDVSHKLAEEFSKAVLKDYNVRDTGYQLLHEDDIYDQICDADKRYIDDKISEIERKR
tara:strand:- start:1571 stop:1828 length:258 start_codon:yes stop_codon:yes gene_type:complete